MTYVKSVKSCEFQCRDAFLIFAQTTQNRVVDILQSQCSMICTENVQEEKKRPLSHLGDVCTGILALLLHLILVVRWEAKEEGTIDSDKR